MYSSFFKTKFKTNRRTARLLVSVGLLCALLFIDGVIGGVAAETKTAKDSKAADKAKPEPKNEPGADGEDPRTLPAVNRVVYIVGDVPITEMDVERMQARVKNNWKRRDKKYKKMSREEVVKDALFRRAIVEMEARKESLLVSDKRIENEIQMRMEDSQMTDEEEFRKLVEKQTGMKYEDWLEDMPYQLLKQQLIRIKVQIEPPGDDEIEKFYQKNKKLMGYELTYQQVIFRANSVSDESRVNTLARKTQGKIQANPKQFSSIARSMGGQYRFYRARPTFEMGKSKFERRVAGLLFQLSNGQLGPLFVGDGRRYTIVMLLRKRTTPLAKIRQGIRNRLMMENVEKSFDKWIEKKKKETAIIEVK